MTLYLFSPDGNPIQAVPTKGHFKLPNGDIVSPVIENWKSPDGYYFAQYIVPSKKERKPQKDIETDLEAWRKTAEISQFQAHYMLTVWGVYDEVKAIAEDAGNPVAMAFERASVWKRNSPAILELSAKLKMPDGSTPTAEVLDEFFRQARSVEV